MKVEGEPMKGTNLNDRHFIRDKLFSDNKSAYERYSELVIGSNSIPKLFQYELITCLLGSLPGAIGFYLRKVFYPKLFSRIGKNVIFGRNITIRNPDRVIIEDQVVIDDYAHIDGRGTGEDYIKIGKQTIIGSNVKIISKVGSIVIGEKCNIGAFSTITSQGGITIEKGTQIAGSCKISGGLFRFNPDKTEIPYFDVYTNGEIRIKENCMIGGNTLIIDGVCVGKCSMLGAGSIVTKDLPDYSIYTSRPGMVIGKTINEVSR